MRMLYRLNRTLKQHKGIASIFVLVVPVLFFAVLVLIPARQVSAVGESFVFINPSNEEKNKAIAKDIKDNNFGASTLKATRITSKDGVWKNSFDGITGNGTVEFQYNEKPWMPDGKDRDDICGYYNCSPLSSGEAKDRFFYTFTYHCGQENGTWVPNGASSANNFYTINLILAVDLGENFYKADSHEFALFTGRVTKKDGAQISPRDLPSACRFQNRTGRMANYNNLSQAEKDKWQGADLDVQLADESISLTTEPEDEADVCDELGPLSWIVCPIVEATVGAVEVLDNMINNLLTVDTGAIFNTSDANSSGANYKQAWSTFRTIALGLIVIAALIVIIATAFGLEILDAYTIRKILPRLLLSIIFITLSWNIMHFLIQLSNDVGNGVRALIYMPFGDMALNFSGITGLLTWFTLGGAIVAFTAIGTLSFAVTALLAVLIAFLVLIIRELIIVLLVLIAPIGIACLILPNTRKGWQLWQNTFTAMLIVFPIISAMIATGRVFAITVSNRDNTGVSGVPGDIVNDIIAFFAYLLPYFMLPFAFRAAGGLMATLAGISNDQSRGMFDRMKKYRGGKMEESMAKMKAGNRYSNNAISRPFNNLTSRAGLGVQGNFGFGKRGLQARSQLEETAALEQVMKNPKWLGIHQNDDALHALTYNNVSEAKAALTKRWGDAARAERAVNAAQASVRFGRSQQIAAARQLVSTGTGYDNIEDMVETLSRASGGNISTAAALSGFANSETKKAGRHDLAPGFGDLNMAVQQAAGIDPNSATGGSVAVSTPDFDALRTKAWQSGSLYQHANDKPQNIQAAIDHHSKLLQSSKYSDREDAAVFFNELKAMSPNSTGVVKVRIDQALDANNSRLNDFYTEAQANPPRVEDLPSPQRVIVGSGHGPRPESVRERIDRRSRTYERPDPNTMQP